MKRPGRWETVSSLRDGNVSCRGEWTSLCTLYMELPSLRAHSAHGGNIVTGLKRRGCSRACRGLWIWQIWQTCSTMKEPSWEVQRCLLSVVILWEFLRLFFDLTLCLCSTMKSERRWIESAWRSFTGTERAVAKTSQLPAEVILWYPVRIRRLLRVTMRMMCLLVVLLAMLVMLGLPKAHNGPHRAHRFAGSHKSSLCKQLPNNFEVHQKYKTSRKSHSKGAECDQLLYSKCSHIS